MLGQLRVAGPPPLPPGNAARLRCAPASGDDAAEPEAGLEASPIPSFLARAKPGNLAAVTRRLGVSSIEARCLSEDVPAVTTS